MRSAVIVAWAVAIAVQMLFPVGLAVWFHRRHHVGWRPFVYGALVFFVFQMMTRVPAVLVLGRLIAPLVRTSKVWQAVHFAGLGLTAGLFESVGRWAGYKWLFRQRLQCSWRNAVAYGIGHAGIESALLVGVSSLATLLQATQITRLTAEQLPALYPAEVLEQILVAREEFLSMSWYIPLWGALERLLTIPFHVGMSLIVLMVFSRGQSRWLWVSVALHATVDFTAPAMLQILDFPVWAVELYVMLWAALGLWITLKYRPPSCARADLQATPV
jgi:uncharacterized membrane protein YhfC